MISKSAISVMLAAAVFAVYVFLCVRPPKHPDDGFRNLEVPAKAASTSIQQSETPSTSAHGKRPLKVHPALTPKQIKALRELPPVCISDLPGLVEKNQGTGVFQNPAPAPAPTQTKTIRLTSAQAPAGHPQEGNRNRYPVASRPVNGQTGGFKYPYPPQHQVPRTNNPRPANSSLRVAGQPARSNNFPLRSDALANYNPHKNATRANRKAKAKARNAAYVKKVEAQISAKLIKQGQDPHAGAFSRTRYPSADECRVCHQQIYEEWASSSHAYASISPMFHRFEDTINRLAQGTLGYFCLRCHAPVATTMGLRRDQAIWDGPKVFREGVTCVACHRVSEAYNKTDGERRMEPGDIYAPVYGGSDGIGVEKAVKYGGYLKTKADPKIKGPGQPIHRRSIKFTQLSKSSFCMSCHQVAVKPGIKLEVVWEQYRASPAFRKGITCQDCHMGKVPGRAEGYSIGPAAVVNGKVVNPDRKHSNHVFYGPGYSIAHPGIFPQTVEGNRWTVNEWLQFNWRAGWGTDAFEDALAEGKFTCYFPPAWQEVDDRYDARDIVDANLKKLKYKRELRKQLFENSSRIDGPYFARKPALGRALKFHYCLSNLNNGHNMPSGSLGAQPQLWLNVVLIGPDGRRLWESGYLDSIGDLADLQSFDVQKRKVPFDKQLFNLQTKFLTTNAKGTDREMPLPVNVDIDQIPFIRPAPQPTTVINHPPFIRMEGHSLPPLGKREAKYIVPGHLLKQPGTYRLSIRMRSRAEPIYFMRFVKATAEMERMMNEWICDSHAYTVTFDVE